MAKLSVFLNVQNIEKSVEFYERLGFKVLTRHKNHAGVFAWADLEFEGADFGLGHIPSNNDPDFQKWASTPLGAGVVVYFTVDDVDAVHERARAAGAVIEVPIEDRSYGRVFTLNDPDGYTITFMRE